MHSVVNRLVFPNTWKLWPLRFITVWRRKTGSNDAARSYAPLDCCLGLTVWLILSSVVSTRRQKVWEFEFHGFNSFFEVHQNLRCQCAELRLWASLLVCYVGELRDTPIFQVRVGHAFVVWVYSHLLKGCVNPYHQVFRQIQSQGSMTLFVLE